METETKADNSSSKCCIGCVIWEKFGKDCHYYWENKKQCTMRANDWDGAAMQQQ